MTREMISTSDLIGLVQDSNTIVMEITDIPHQGSCIILVQGGEWVKAELCDDLEEDYWVVQRWPLYPKCEGPMEKDVVVRWLKG
jgi:hypothetical protein